MITARQSRAARALLGWTQETLADKARISLTALKRLESESGLDVYETTRDQARRGMGCCWSMIMGTSRTDPRARADLWAAKAGPLLALPPFRTKPR